MKRYVALALYLVSSSTFAQNLACPGEPLGTFPDPRPKPTSIVGARIVLNPGHGLYTDNGQNWKYQRPQLKSYGSDAVFAQEDQSNMKMAQVVFDTLKAAGAEVYSTRDLNMGSTAIGISKNLKWRESAQTYFKSQNISPNIWNHAWPAVSRQGCNYDRDIRARAFYANQLGADVVVGIHSNAGATSDVRGTLVLYSTINRFPETPDWVQGESARLAQAVQNSVVVSIQKSRPDLAWPTGKLLPSPANHGEISFTKMPAIIVEVGYHTNPKDAQGLNEKRFREAVAQGIKEGLDIYFSQNNPAPAINPEAEVPNPDFPNAPVLVDPKNDVKPDALGAVYFTWTPVNGSDRYTLSIRKAPYGDQDTVYTRENIPGVHSSLTLFASSFQNSKAVTDFRWFLVAFKGNEATPVSLGLDFKIK